MERKTYTVKHRVRGVRSGWRGAWDALKAAATGRERRSFLTDIEFSVSILQPEDVSVELSCAEVRCRD